MGIAKRYNITLMLEISKLIKGKLHVDGATAPLLDDWTNHLMPCPVQVRINAHPQI